MAKEETYQVKKLNPRKEYLVRVPGSKSITNRAFLLAALSGKTCVLSGALFSDDTRGFLDCLIQLGFQVEIEEEKQRVTIQGMNGRIPNPEASIHVRSAGTAARFLTVALAFAGGSYHMDASEQMRKRPMEPILKILEELNVKFTFNNEKYHFPFDMRSEREEDSKMIHPEIKNEITIDTNLSSQFASALLMAACLLPNGLRIHLTGTRTAGSYIKMTLAMMKQFGIQVKQSESCYEISHQEDWGLTNYEIEPDVSAACYFYAMAPLLKTSVIVKGAVKDSLQGDIQFLNVLEQMGCRREDTPDGIRMSMTAGTAMQGVDISMKDFSDQTMTLAAIAPFAAGPTRIHNIGHIRFQESDRLHAILTELQRMGVHCEEVPEIDGIEIWPLECETSGEDKTVTQQEKSRIEIETYEDHRMAMAFTLPGLKTGNITIKNPGCCRKTFENYFTVIDSLYTSL